MLHLAELCVGHGHFQCKDQVQHLGECVGCHLLKLGSKHPLNLYFWPGNNSTHCLSVALYTDRLYNYTLHIQLSVLEIYCDNWLQYAARYEAQLISRKHKVKLVSILSDFLNLGAPSVFVFGHLAALFSGAQCVFMSTNSAIAALLGEKLGAIILAFFLPVSMSSGPARIASIWFYP